MKGDIISVQNLKKSYGKHIVLDGLNFKVERGSIFALLGENGTGKTTTVRILATLIQADSGIATIAGYNTHREPESVRQQISLTGQYASVDELLTGEENLMMMGRLNHLNRDAVKKRTSELLKQFELVNAAKKSVKTYSGGMRRRLDIAISLLVSPQVIFLDEPTTGLDPRSRRNMWNLIQQLSEDGVTIFLTTQYLEEADQLADKIAVIDNGKIVEEGTAEELKRMIGDEKLELTFDDLEVFQLASKLLQAQANEKEHSISIQNGSPENLRNLLNTLHEHGIEPSSINFRKPTLDDVFIDITSRKRRGRSVHA
ncbi:ATP-binding cassette domain-containing protein [Oceanobacillus profundus]|uniref:ATP-binding cassette domain-containing protein n=1 Tax=Oceanobacillus TaxID=182709 RepID=UPI0026E1A748|nr:ATP-binding cassette domain-containing protein [Oceanobacillus profundus]MDO6449919.1 ATP-binding cassette domain-containing protein [Oceanobacillus profundus]